jgi:hypothetical protein
LKFLIILLNELKINRFLLLKLQAVPTGRQAGTFVKIKKILLRKL